MSRLDEVISYLKKARAARDDLKNAFNIDGEQVLCDGYSCISLNESGKFTLKETPGSLAPKNKGLSLTENIRQALNQEGGELYISIKRLEAFIKAKRAERKAAHEKDLYKRPLEIDAEFLGIYHKPIYNISDVVSVDSVRLLRIMRIIATGKQLVKITYGKRKCDPVGISGAFGSALLLPVIRR